LLATDIAARGLDIPNIKTVIIYDVPNNVDNYIHRIGRTGRIGHPGIAHVLVEDKPCFVYRDILEVMLDARQDIPDWFAELASGNKTCREEDYERIPQRAFRRESRGIKGAYNFSRSSSLADHWKNQERRDIWGMNGQRSGNLFNDCWDYSEFQQEKRNSDLGCRRFEKNFVERPVFGKDQGFQGSSHEWQFSLSQGELDRDREMIREHEPLRNSNFFNMNREEMLIDAANFGNVKQEE
jgi:superfamily II DNA/RNA helicase